MKRISMNTSSVRLKYDRAERAFNAFLKAHNGMLTSQSPVLPKEMIESFRALESEIGQMTGQLQKSEDVARAKRIKHRPEIKSNLEEKKLEKKNADLRKEKLLAIKRNNDKLEAKREQERRRLDYDRTRRNVMPTRIIDESKLIKVQLDKNTTIMIRPDQDPEKIKQKFRDRNN